MGFFGKLLRKRSGVLMGGNEGDFGGILGIFIAGISILKVGLRGGEGF